jgi:hypothetical protein
MIDIKRASEIARKGLIELLGKQELADEAGITLEEFEMSEDKKYWDITLGYPVRERRKLPKAVNEMLGSLADEPRRRFKTFRIDTKDGNLVAMKLIAR